MLDNNDKKWLVETINNVMDVRFVEQDKRLNENMDKRFAEQDKRLNENMDKRFAEQEKRLDETMDIRFADIIKSVDKRIEEQFDRFEKGFMLMFENEIKPILAIHREVLPGAYKTYAQMEERMDKMELDFDILKNALSARM